MKNIFLKILAGYALEKRDSDHDKCLLRIMSDSHNAHELWKLVSLSCGKNNFLRQKQFYIFELERYETQAKQSVNIKSDK